MRDTEIEQLWHQVNKVRYQLQSISDELTRIIGGMNPEAFGILNMIPELPRGSSTNPLTIAEVGVYEADTTIHLLKRLNVEKYYAIDPWKYDSQNNEVSTVKDDVDERNVYAHVKERLQDYDNVQIVKKRSMDALDEIEDNSLDFCFIDGDHDAQAVYDDILGYYEKVKPGGLIIGDDWHWLSVRTAVFTHFGIDLAAFTAPVEQNAVAKSKGIGLVYEHRESFKLWYFMKNPE